MSKMTSRIQGIADQAGGKIKKTVGQAIGNEQMQLEGQATELKGKAEQAAAKAAQRTKGAVEQVTGTLKAQVGKIIGNEQMEAEGTGRKLMGKARQRANP